MTGSDDEFEDFLRRRKPVFRAPDDMFEPPAELDRVVLRKAREAIQTEPPLRVFRGPRWAMPIGLAATLVLAFTVIFQAGAPTKRAPVPEVTVQNVSQPIDYPEAAAPRSAAPSSVAENTPPEEATASGSVIVDLAPGSGGFVAADDSERHAAAAQPAAAPAPMIAARSQTADTSMESPAAKASDVPTWRRDSKAWLAEIERLRNAGDGARADAELAEYKRQQRAYAGAPDR